MDPTNNGDATDAKPQTMLGISLADLRRHLPRSVIDGPGWDRLMARVGDLPGEAFSYCCFEFRLGDATPEADVCVSAPAGRDVARHLIRKAEGAAPDSPAAALAKHLRAMDGGDPALADAVLATGLEYDLIETVGGKPPPPGVFLSLDKEVGPNDAGEVPLAALATAVGWSEFEGERKALQWTLAKMPEHSRVTFVGALPGRGLRGVRLVVAGIRYREVADVLKSLNWQGDADAAAETLWELRDVLRWFRLAVDVTTLGISPRMGFEMFVEAEKQANYDRMDTGLFTSVDDWRPVADALAQRGWCVPEKAQGLLDWCAMDRLIDADGISLLYRSVNHVKLTMMGGETAAKAYGGVCRLPVGDRAAPAEAKDAE